MTTLRELFEDHIAIDQHARSQRTIREYETLLRDWERLMHNMPAEKLNRQALIQFRDRLNVEKARSPATINKKMRFIKPLVRLAWPKDSANTGGLGLCDYFQAPARLKEYEKLPIVLEEWELNALYENAPKLAWPNYAKRWGLSATEMQQERYRRQPGITWRCVMVMHYFTGPRAFDLYGLKWGDLNYKDFNGMGSINFNASKTTKLQRIPMHPLIKVHVNRLAECVPGEQQKPSDRLFPGFTQSNYSSVRRNWQKLLFLSDVRLTLRQEDFRKTCNTILNDIAPGVGEWVLGHDCRSVNARNYYNPTAKVIEAINEMPVPTAWGKGETVSPEQSEN